MICPSGAKNTHFEFQVTDKGYDHVGYCHRQRLGTPRGRNTSAEHQGLERDFEQVYAGVRRAFHEKVVRLRNPVVLLEYGMQVCTPPLGSPPLGILMFVMALDMLVMTSNTKGLVDRLGGFLEPQAYVFLANSMGGQPGVKVQDVIADLYEFRNRMAHGREIPAKYREAYDLLDTHGDSINDREDSYVDILCQAGLFMLTAALRKVFVDQLVDDVSDEKRWRGKLRICEDRWKRRATINRPPPSR